MVRPSPQYRNVGPAFGELWRSDSSPRPTKVKKTAVEKAIIKHILPRLHRLASGVKVGDEKRQHSRADLNRHLAALWANRWLDQKVDRNDIIPKLNGNHVVDHQRHGKQLLTYSTWKSGLMLVRIETDVHMKSHTRAREALEYIKQKYLPQMVIFPSSNGWSGYIWLQVPTYLKEVQTGPLKWEVKPVPCCKLVELNRFREHLHTVIGPLMKSLSFPAPIEAHGSFLERKYFRDEHGFETEPSIIKEGALGTRRNVKLPHFETVEQVEAFAGAVIRCDPRHGNHDAGLRQLILDGEAAFAAGPAAEPKQSALFSPEYMQVLRMSDERVEAAMGGEELNWDDLEQLKKVIAWRPPVTPGKRRKLDRITIANDPTDKLGLALKCIVRARMLLDIHTRAEMEIRRDDILELAHTLYEENNLSPNSRDKQRDERFKGAFKFLLKTFDGARDAGKGNDPDWIDMDIDIPKVAEKLRSTPLAMQMIADFNASKLAKKHGLLKPYFVATVIAFRAKNSQRHDKPVLMKKLLRVLMHKHPEKDLSADGSLIKAATDIGVALDLINLETAHVAPHWEWVGNAIQWVKGKLARFAINMKKVHWFPFLRSIPKQVADDQNKAVSGQRVPNDSLTGTADGNCRGEPIFSSSQYKGGSALRVISIEPTSPAIVPSWPSSSQLFEKFRQLQQGAVAALRDSITGVPT